MAWLAKKVNCDRSNFCKKLKNNNLETELLFRISEVLQEDFLSIIQKYYVVKFTTKKGKISH